MTSAADSRLLEVGRIGKPHGLAGDLLVDFVTDRLSERTTSGAELLAGDRRLVVASARRHGNRWLVRFAGVDDRAAAALLTGSVLSAEPLDDPDALFVHQLIGCRLIDQNGTDHGEVVAVVANPASDLLELADGRLVPLAFLVEHTAKRVTVSVPAGLLDDGS